MENFIKLKKRKIIIFLLLFFNQFLFNGYALNYKKIDFGKSEKNNIQGKFYKTSNILLAEKNQINWDEGSSDERTFINPT